MSGLSLRVSVYRKRIHRRCMYVCKIVQDAIIRLSLIIHDVYDVVSCSNLILYILCINNLLFYFHFTPIAYLLH